MITLRPAAARGRTDLSWLDSRHSFSFAEYRDPAHMGFRSLRVINDDRITPGAGFPTHPHRDMEIVTYVVDGALEHADSMGNGSVIRAGEVQRMTAGTGVTHSEFNHFRDAPARFLQIWILPDRQGIAPSYEQRAFPVESRRGGWRLLAAREGGADAIMVHQDLRLYGAVLSDGEGVARAIAPGRHGWVQVVTGAGVVNGVDVAEGDGVSLSDEAEARVEAGPGGMEALLFDLA